MLNPGCYVQVSDTDFKEVEYWKPWQSYHFDSDPVIVQKNIREKLTKAVDLKLAKKNGDLMLTLTNLSSHNFPTGTGVRIATVVSEFYKGNVKISTQTEKLEVIFAAADGNITLPPMASQELSDTRLKPNEVRILSIAIPKGSTHAVVTINYRLAKEQIVEKFQLRDERFKKVHLVVSKTIKL